MTHKCHVSKMFINVYRAQKNNNTNILIGNNMLLSLRKQRPHSQYYYLGEFGRCERSACFQGKAVRFIKIGPSIDLKYSIATFGSGLRSAVEEKVKKGTGPRLQLS